MKKRYHDSSQVEQDWEKSITYFRKYGDHQIGMTDYLSFAIINPASPVCNRTLGLACVDGGFCRRGRFIAGGV